MLAALLTIGNWRQSAIIRSMNAKFFLVALLLGACAPAQAVTPTTAREIGQLFKVLERSNCQFSRNGAWYAAAKASEHLQRKYDYLQKKGLVTSTESFIELAATKSSMSGNPYQVRCGTGAAVASQAWFTGKLRELRQSPANAGSERQLTH
ncbi:YfeK family protein [Xanthomonas sp. 3058]|uniref:DUF5329 domain-containing protein n=1 Tax=Xanthomonas sp. 3058 TaxID=3035314 RepID=UPI00183EA6B0|nr:YfeK family protein [Xanthomonas sp. 3058]MBB5866342.1 hypothetical protein [Xanthomonas sp. 3058]